MIHSFSNKDTERLFRTESSRRFTAVARVALRKLIQLNNAASFATLPSRRESDWKG